MNTTILIYVDSDAHEASVVVPPPKGGPLKVEKVVNEEGLEHYVLRTSKAAKEQLAYHHFWLNGTDSRIAAIVADGKQGSAGVTKTLRWLVSVRVREALRATGYLYEVQVVKGRPTSEQATAVCHGLKGTEMGEGLGWLYDLDMNVFLKPASYNEAAVFKRDGQILVDIEKGVKAKRCSIRYPEKGKPAYGR